MFLGRVLHFIGEGLTAGLSGTTGGWSFTLASGFGSSNCVVLVKGFGGVCGDCIIGIEIECREASSADF